MDEKKRRSLLGLSATIFDSPKVWTKPLVVFVTLPAHAQTSISIELVSESTIRGPGGEEISFLRASQTISASKVLFVIKMNADLSTFLFPDEGPSLSSAHLSTEAGDQVTLGGFCETKSELARVESGVNTFKLEFPIETNKIYTDLNLQFHTIYCGPKFTGAFVFKVNVFH